MMGFPCEECDRVIGDHDIDHGPGCFHGRVWRLWHRLPDDERSPVHFIAAELAPDTMAAVAAIVFPADRFGPWSATDEPVR